MIHEAVSIAELQKTLEHLSTFSTRNTNTPQCKQAVEWLADQFGAIPRMQVEVMAYPLARGRRVPEEATAYQVIATLPGRSPRRMMMGAHLDTISLEGDPMTAIAPGINDDGSGVAATLESARILARQEWENTLIFVGFTGEEQGLLGSTALATRAKQEAWPIEALLSNDTVGASRTPDGRSDPARVRVYSEESSDHRSRELARFLEWNARGKLGGFAPWLVFRKDRFQRGGDHSPFNAQGFTAVRLIESLEAFSHQHTDRDTLDFIDFEYLANVTKLNVHSLASLGSAGPAPTEVSYAPKQGYDTTLRWSTQPDVQYTVYWRQTDSAVWQHSHEIGKASEYTVSQVNKDDHVFAVGSAGGIPVSAG